MHAMHDFSDLIITENQPLWPKKSPHYYPEYEIWAIENKFWGNPFKVMLPFFHKLGVSDAQCCCCCLVVSEYCEFGKEIPCLYIILYLCWRFSDIVAKHIWIMIFLGSLMKILQQAEKYRVGVSLNKLLPERPHFLRSERGHNLREI